MNYELIQQMLTWLFQAIFMLGIGGMLIDYSYRIAVEHTWGIPQSEVKWSLGIPNQFKFC